MLRTAHTHTNIHIEMWTIVVLHGYLIALAAVAAEWQRHSMRRMCANICACVYNIHFWQCAHIFAFRMCWNGTIERKRWTRACKYAVPLIRSAVPASPVVVVVVIVVWQAILWRRTQYSAKNCENPFRATVIAVVDVTATVTAVGSDECPCLRAFVGGSRGILCEMSVVFFDCLVFAPYWGMQSTCLLRKCYCIGHLEIGRRNFIKIEYHYHNITSLHINLVSHLLCIYWVPKITIKCSTKRIFE